jgi:hypothetical protein
MTRSATRWLQSIPAAGVAADDSGLSPESVPGHDAEEIITRLYKDNGAFILGYVTGLLRDRYLAEDVVQETMLRAWRYCARFSPAKGSVRGWLIRVAHNIAMDKIRMRQSRPPEVAQYDTSLALVKDHADSGRRRSGWGSRRARCSPGRSARCGCPGGIWGRRGPGRQRPRPPDRPGDSGRGQDVRWFMTRSLVRVWRSFSIS